LGEITVVAYAILALLAVLLLGAGLLLKKRAFTMAGSATLLGLAGGWFIGLPGFVLAAVPLIWRKRSP